MNFEDGTLYTGWITERDREVLPEGYRYRLPTDSELTIFAQCGDGRVYPWGNNFPPMSGRAGNYADETLKREVPSWSWWIIDGYDDGHAVSAPVDESWVNPWGLAGVGGNVWEMCADDTDSVSFGAWRGMSWHDGLQDALRCFDRFDIGGSVRHFNLGFRLVLSR